MDLEKETARVNFIPCLTWVQRGVAKQVPDRVKLTEEELAAVIEQTKGDLKDLEEGGDKVEAEDGEDAVESEPVVKQEDGETDIMKEYDLENYDDEKEESAQNMFGLGDLAMFSDPSKDPYMGEGDDAEDNDEENDDFNIRPNDNLIVVGHVEDDASTVEVYVYNDVDEAFYIHHDILLPAFPLALEWLSFDPESDKCGNMVAIGSMSPIVEVWDLDIVDSLEPAFRLGRKGKKKKGISRIGHKDAVLALAWNRHAEHVLASGSVDQTVALWDMTTQDVASSLKSHKEKVQSLCWHPQEAQTLLTGCCDKLVRAFDCRAQDTCKSWKLTGEIERVLWDHFNPYQCLASTSAGTVHCIDVRQDEPLWTLAAHTQEVTGISLSTQCPGCLTTVSQDKMMKVWDISGAQPQFVMERNMKLGALQTIVGCPDAPFVVCMGGDKTGDGNLKVMDLRDSADVRQRFGSRKLQNPLGTADFGFSTADEAEPEQEMEVAASALENMDISSATKTTKISGGAASKFKNKNKNKDGKKKKSEF